VDPARVRVALRSSLPADLPSLRWGPPEWFDGTGLRTPECDVPQLAFLAAH
jgi:hypothetical protein